jgi:hypothetical protein
MIAEYALIPDVFAQSSYVSLESCDRNLRDLKDGLISRGLVRNLYNGGWWNYVQKHSDRWDKRGRELLKKLKQQGRLCESLPCADELPENASAWCAEALASHAQAPLGGIVADESTATEHLGNDAVAPVTKLTEQTWWLGGKNSIELKRTTDAYLQALGPTLRHSNSIMFVDPHLDPSKPHYSSFTKLIAACGMRTPSPRIEIHRVCYSDPQDKRLQPGWEKTFKDSLGAAARDSDLRIEVFLWQDFHDRYLISNLIGVLIPNGFDVEKSPSITRWARLDREHRDSVEREFDPAAGMHRLEHRFML